MKINKGIYIVLLLTIYTSLFSKDININDFKLSSYGLKSYTKSGKIKSEASFTAQHNPTKIIRYYYNEEDKNLVKKEYYAIKSPDPEYINYIYEENTLTESVSFNSNGRMKLITKYFYENSIETKKEHYDSKSKLRSIQLNYYNTKNQIQRREYLGSNNAIFQHNLYYYDKNRRESKVEIFKKGKFYKSYETFYLENGNIDKIYYYNEHLEVNMIQENKYDDKNQFIEYKVYKKIRK